MQSQKESTRSNLTLEALSVFEREATRLRADLYEVAYLEALRQRGEPVEITASDVRRAGRRVVVGGPPAMSSSTLILRLYVLIGLLTFIGGLLYPAAVSALRSMSGPNRIAYLVAASGLALSVVSMLLSLWMAQRQRERMRLTADADADWEDRPLPGAETAEEEADRSA